MNIDRLVFLLGGSFVLLSLLLSQLVSEWWLLLAALVGVNMIQSSFTGFCPPAYLFRKLGVKPGPAFFRCKIDSDS
jgi:hypothetical protein